MRSSVKHLRFLKNFRPKTNPAACFFFSTLSLVIGNSVLKLILIIHDKITKEVTTVKGVWIPGHILRILWSVWEATLNTWKNVSSGIQTPQSGFKKNSAVPIVFQPTSLCLDIWMKHPSFVFEKLLENYTAWYNCIIYFSLTFFSGGVTSTQIWTTSHLSISTFGNFT